VVLISEVVTSASQASVTFSSIPTTWRDLEVRVRGAGDAAAGNVNVLVQLNSDTGSNYAQWSKQSNSTNSAGGAGTIEAVAVQSTSTTSIFGGYLSAATSAANAGSFAEFTIPDYKGTTFHKALSGRSVLRISDTLGGYYLVEVSGYWKNTAAVNAVKVFLNSGNFANNSVVSLYGRF
jgi:hypothetical protein